MVSLKTSDITAMLTSVAIESQGVAIPSTMKALEKSAYQILGRYVAQNMSSSLTFIPDSIDIKDASAGLIAIADSFLRKKRDYKGALMSGLQEGASSFLGKKELELTGMDDNYLIGEPKVAST